MKKEELLGQPAYSQFRDIFSERTNNIVFWVGSGVSAGYGLPVWKDLLKQLRNIGRSKIQSYEESERKKGEAKLELISGLQDNWLSFELLKDLLGQTTYEESIRRALSANSHDFNLYDKLWGLAPSGMLTLNLDKFIVKSFSKINPGKDLNEFSGKDAGPNTHLLKNPTPFIAHLHGTLENTHSWVFTKKELTGLLSTNAYSNFISALLSTRTVLFVGVSADDIAVGGFLENLKSAGTSTGPHFWITNRPDYKTDKWAEDNGIRIIRYESADNSHAELFALFDDLKTYVPHDDIPAPVRAEVQLVNEIPVPDELQKKEPEEIRTILNGYAAKILEPSTPDSLDKYRKFCIDYEYQIHNAWFMTHNPPNNIFFSYTIEEPIGEGAFGKVYRGKGPSGEDVAIKLLREEIRSKPVMLESFRRGVQSMRILSNHKIDGMVPYKTAYEIPACAVMDFVNGPNLKEAIDSRHITRLCDKVRVALELIKIIRSGHNLPERVLHRDIRPANIMLSNYYLDPDGWKVAVLDFDLSWHKDAVGKSVDVQSSAMLSYAAPEQIDPNLKVSTRNALVDSFGIGMTLYFLFTGKEPGIAEYADESWGDKIASNIITANKNRSEFVFVRLVRLIMKATEKEQNKRLDMANIEYEMERVALELETPNKVESVEFVADKILFEAFGLCGYSWNPDMTSGEKTYPSGLRLKLAADEVHREICLQINWISAGHESKTGLVKYMPAIKEKITSEFIKKDWRVIASEIDRGWALNIIAILPAVRARKDTKDVVKLIESISKEIRF